MVSKSIGTKTEKLISYIATPIEQLTANGGRESVKEFFESVAKGFAKTNNQKLVANQTMLKEGIVETTVPKLNEAGKIRFE